MRRRSLVWLVVALTLVVACLVVADAHGASTLAASAWCPIKSGGSPKCDEGLAISVWRFRAQPRAHVVAALGTRSLGVGVAWVVTAPGDGVSVAIAAGGVAPYDEDGIASRLYPALGVTLSFWGGGR